MMQNVRKYGKSPFNIAVIHGGPGAPGEMKPVAEELSKQLSVLEPLQTKDSIEGQIQELKVVLEQNGNLPITLIGYSWGAWLSFIFAAKYPNLVKKLILVACGPFKEKYVSQIIDIRLNRLTLAEKERVKKIMKSLEKGTKDKKDVQDFEMLMRKADSYNPLPAGNNKINFQDEIYQNVWPEASALRKSGKLLDYGKNITCPVISIHGSNDPHPFIGVKEPLSKVLKKFEFILLDHCGHIPWEEREAKDTFYTILRRKIT